VTFARCRRTSRERPSERTVSVTGEPPGP
jgi:hypothetical protein